MTVLTRNPESLTCSHDAIHGPDSEPGAVQRCTEETILIRVQASAEGRAVEQAMEVLQEKLGALQYRIIRETLRLTSEVGTLNRLVMEPDDDYGRSQPWDPEGVTDDR